MFGVLVMSFYIKIGEDRAVENAFKRMVAELSTLKTLGKDSYLSHRSLIVDNVKRQHVHLLLRIFAKCFLKLNRALIYTIVISFSTNLGNIFLASLCIK